MNQNKPDAQEELAMIRKLVQSQGALGPVLAGNLLDEVDRLRLQLEQANTRVLQIELSEKGRLLKRAEKAEQELAQAKEEIDRLRDHLKSNRDSALDINSTPTERLLYIHERSSEALEGK